MWPWRNERRGSASEQAPVLPSYAVLYFGQRSRYSEVVAAGLPVDEHIEYILEGVLFPPVDGDVRDNG